MHDILGSLSSMAEAMTSSFEVDPERKLIISVIEVFKIWSTHFLRNNLFDVSFMVRSCQIYLMSRQNETLKSKKTWTWSQLTNFPKKCRLEGVWCQQSGDLTLRRRIAARSNHVELKVTRRIGNCRDAMLLQLSHCKSSLVSCPDCCDDMIISKPFIRWVSCINESQNLNVFAFRQLGATNTQSVAMTWIKPEHFNHFAMFKSIDSY